MKRSTKFAGALAAVAAAPILAAGNAQADAGTVYFSVGSTNCAIFANGSLGCDLASPMYMSYYIGDTYVPVPVPVNEIAIDQPWLPAHPTFDPGTPYTLPGGNPRIDDVKTGSGPWGPIIEHAGASCQVGFHGSFTCQALGRGFSTYGSTIVA
ncbi:hypothetical protein [Nocardia gamkensis]|uniref:Secreted protein n=1 Tax=Nocardia gamkensis TaxID=352869 RepID=A0A7X6R5M9_9NOCA|nr:hypothetical protein [Nocardia gamkensis]NKY29663.1 hypothetical protein [Nocardia gamkensis]NQE70526.1 hypothetical protein [Nocardia gamkensis]